MLRFPKDIGTTFLVSQYLDEPNIVFWKGYDKALETNVLVQIMPKARIRDKKLLSEFMSEISVLSTFDHPLFLKLIRSNEDRDNYYLIYEYPRGELISQEHFPYSEEVTKNLFTQMLDALIYLKSVHIRHNVRFAPFGIYMDDDKITNLLIFGNTFYTLCGKSKKFFVQPSPEMIQGNHSAPAWDSWYCGAFLYFFMMGRPPFTGETQDELDCAILGQRPEIPEAWSSSLKELLSGLLMKNPITRLPIGKAVTSGWVDPEHRHTLQSEGLVIPMKKEPSLMELEQNVVSPIRSRSNITLGLKSRVADPIRLTPKKTFVMSKKKPMCSTPVPFVK